MNNRNQNGMTLIELMIVVAIVGILATIAYPSYREQVLRSGRTDGKVALEQRATALEKCYTRFMKYTDCASLLAAGDSENKKYSVAATGTTTVSTYTLRATPQGSQASDAKCKNLQLDSTGKKTIAGGTSTPEECWQR